MIARDKNGNVIAESADGVNWTRRADGEVATLDISGAEAALFADIMGRWRKPVPRCATCRWARATIAGQDISEERAQEFPLICERPDGTNLSAALYDWSWSDSIGVRPEFGCVQWEGKVGKVVATGLNENNERVTITLDPGNPLCDAGTLTAREIAGDVVFECPACRKADPDGPPRAVATNAAKPPEQIPGGLRWVGVPCPFCGATYTVEAVDEDLLPPEAKP